MKKLIVAYRDNDLFSKYVPKILSHVPSNVNIEKIVFPAGTDIENIKEKLVTKLNKVEIPFFYLSDNTCSMGDIADESLSKKWHNDEIESYAGLDIVFKEAVREAFKAQYFVTVLKEITQIIIQKPAAIYIVRESITDHLKGFKDKEKFQAEYEGREHKFAKFLQKILQELYPKAEIYIKYDLGNALRECSDKENALLVADRHCGIYKEMKDAWNITTWPYEAKLLLLPFENAIGHLVTMRKIDKKFDDAVLYQKISERLSLEQEK